MIYDKKLVMSKAQALTETAASTDTLDFEGTDAAKIGDGRPVYLRVEVDTLFVTANAGTLAIALQDSADGTTYADVVATPAIAVASLTKGAELLTMAVPEGLRRHIRMNYTVANAFTAGKITSYLTV